MCSVNLSQTSPLHCVLPPGLCSNDGLVTIARPLVQAEVSRLLPGPEPGDGRPGVTTGSPPRPLTPGTQHLQLVTLLSSQLSRPLSPG